MQFKRYQKIERYGRSGVYGINEGECFVFHKLDGTNGSVWFNKDTNSIQAGSRNRLLSQEKDNAGFYKEMIQNQNITQFLQDNPTLRLYGEFLVPHTLKNYKDDAWREFYVFDVVEENDNSERYLHYNEYVPLLESYNIPYIPAIARVENGSFQDFCQFLDKTTFLTKEGVGEGIVIKNYNFKNRFGNVVWAKIISDEFKSRMQKTNQTNVPQQNEEIEFVVVDKYCTDAFIEKEYAKIVNTKEGWQDKYIPILLRTVWYEFLVEEVPQIVKDMKHPIIDFKKLNQAVIKRIKYVKSDLF